MKYIDFNVKDEWGSRVFFFAVAVAAGVCKSEKDGVGA